MGSQKTNRLASETSPYLLQHQHNPVDWFPWGEEAFRQAREQDKPIFLSIGYAACHWCHVMERECFEDGEIAEILNKHFISIKVDREQRPDVDAQYMLAVQMMTQHGGWPMSVFLTPELKPFYGGTYFPKEQFKLTLRGLAEAYQNSRFEVNQQAERLADAIRDAFRARPPGKLDPETPQIAANQLLANHDARHGGFGRAPKFPNEPQLRFLLEYYLHTKDQSILNAVTLTLDKMAAGGVYDHLGGGFARYSTDAIWRVPHFEKMLYNQAQLADVYLRAYQITGTQQYRRIVEETLEYVLRDLTDPCGAFHSAEDADSEGEEGKYYLWTTEDVGAVLDTEAGQFCALYGVTPEGDLDGKSVLHLRSLDISHPKQTEWKQKMLAVRSKRARPSRDDKILTSWNGLMIAALADAGRILEVPCYTQAARHAADFIWQTLQSNGRLFHSHRNGISQQIGFLEDYAHFLSGLLSLFVTLSDRTWLLRAETLVKTLLRDFLDSENGGFYQTAEQGELLARSKDPDDGALPSPNGILAQCLLHLAKITGTTSYAKTAGETVEAFAFAIRLYPSAYPTLLTAQLMAGSSLDDSA